MSQNFSSGSNISDIILCRVVLGPLHASSTALAYQIWHLPDCYAIFYDDHRVGSFQILDEALTFLFTKIKESSYISIFCATPVLGKIFSDQPFTDDAYVLGAESGHMLFLSSSFDKNEITALLAEARPQYLDNDEDDDDDDDNDINTNAHTRRSQTSRFSLC